MKTMVSAVARLLACAMTVASPAAWAADAPPPAAPVDQPSDFLRCDGQPGHTGAAGTIGKLLVITATAGIGGAAFSHADVRKRASGMDGVAACDAAIKQEGNDQRRAELGLARTIHYIEAHDFAGAVTSAQGIPALVPHLATDPGFLHGALPSSQYLEAYALARMDRPAEAQAVAVRMAAAQPYDVLANDRALMFLRINADMDAAKAQVFANLVRLDPAKLIDRATAKAWVGDFAGAADDIADLTTTLHSFVPGAHLAIAHAWEAVYRAQAGQSARAHDLAKQAADENDALVASGQASSLRSEVDQTDELIAFLAVGDALASGNAAQARTLYAAHPHWISVPAPVVAAMVGRLRQGAASADLTGPLADTPEAVRDKGFHALVASLSANDDTGGGLYRAVWETHWSEFQALIAPVWRVGEKPAFLVKRAGAPAGAETISVFRPGTVQGEASGEALLLHAALITRARGETSFVLQPVRRSVAADGVILGPQPGTLPASVSFDAPTVIAALGPHFPQPVAGRTGPS